VRTTVIGGLVVSLALTGVLATAAAADPAIANACPGDRVPPSFFDDTYDNIHEDAIDCVVWYEVAYGVSTYRYAPRQDVRRDQMASFMARAVTAMRGSLRSGEDTFDDVDGGPHGDAIERLAAVGIVRGTSSSAYSPSRSVDRGQMATFLVRAYEYLTGETLQASRDYFSDDDGSTHEANINKAAEAGFTSGLGAGRYGPEQSVRRDQMASFIARMLDRAVDRAPGGRSAAYPLGTPKLLIDDWEVTFVSSDQDATDVVMAENEFNDPPADGHQFFMARIRATYRGPGSSRLDAGFRFRAVGPAGVVYTTFGDSCGVIPDEYEDPETFSGGTTEGNLCWEVRSSDASGLLAFDDGDPERRPNRPYFALTP
jgi:hypothetical protein